MSHAHTTESIPPLNTWPVGVIWHVLTHYLWPYFLPKSSLICFPVYLFKKTLTYCIIWGHDQHFLSRKFQYQHQGRISVYHVVEYTPYDHLVLFSKHFLSSYMDNNYNNSVIEDSYTFLALLRILSLFNIPNIDFSNYNKIPLFSFHNSICQTVCPCILLQLDW